MNTTNGLVDLGPGVAAARVCESAARLLGVSVSYHDYTGGQLRELLGTGLLNHLNAFCTAVKTRIDKTARTCTGCDIGQVQARLATSREPFIKVCHGGVAEAVLPIRAGKSLAGVLFVGPFSLDEADLEGHGVLVQTKHSRLPAELKLARSRLVEGKWSYALDMMRMGSLLSQHIENAFAQVEQGDAGGGYEARIRRYLRAHATRQTQLRDLAAALFLSESRTSQLVREHFGMTFPALVTRYRLAQARRLLSASRLPVTAVANMSGFEDPAYFHRVFKRSEGATPLAYRKREWKGGGRGEV